VVFTAGLRSGGKGEGDQVECVISLSKVFDKHPFPIFINSACLKLSDCFNVRLALHYSSSVLFYFILFYTELAIASIYLFTIFTKFVLCAINKVYSSFSIVVIIPYNKCTLSYKICTPTYHMCILSYNICILSYNICALSYNIYTLSCNIRTLSCNIRTLSYNIHILSYNICTLFYNICILSYNICTLFVATTLFVSV